MLQAITKYPFKGCKNLPAQQSLGVFEKLGTLFTKSAVDSLLVEILCHQQ
jgi:hypothetical protein